MTKTSVKFRKIRHKTVGGVAAQQGTYYIGGTEGRTEGQKAKNYVPPLFFEKAGDKKKFHLNFQYAKHVRCNILQYFTAVKMEKFRMKKFDIFLIWYFSYYSHWGSSNEYPQSMF